VATYLILSIVLTLGLGCALPEDEAERADQQEATSPDPLRETAPAGTVQPMVLPTESAGEDPEPSPGSEVAVALPYPSPSEIVVLPSRISGTTQVASIIIPEERNRSRLDEAGLSLSIPPDSTLALLDLTMGKPGEEILVEEDLRILIPEERILIPEDRILVPDDNLPPRDTILVPDELRSSSNLLSYFLRPSGLAFPAFACLLGETDDPCVALEPAVPNGTGEVQVTLARKVFGNHVRPAPLSLLVGVIALPGADQNVQLNGVALDTLPLTFPQIEPSAVPGQAPATEPVEAEPSRDPQSGEVEQNSAIAATLVLAGGQTTSPILVVPATATLATGSGLTQWGVWPLAGEEPQPDELGWLPIVEIAGQATLTTAITLQPDEGVQRFGLYGLLPGTGVLLLASSEISYLAPAFDPCTIPLPELELTQLEWVPPSGTEPGIVAIAVGSTATLPTHLYDQVAQSTICQTVGSDRGSRLKILGSLNGADQEAIGVSTLCIFEPSQLDRQQIEFQETNITGYLKVVLEDSQCGRLTFSPWVKVGDDTTGSIAPPDPPLVY